ncbi:hypothetical protein [Escherichia coli]|uniref:hypothetical protein n=1 Tax=Escherichia coli TaxID=562 RepID=UPI0039769B02
MRPWSHNQKNGKAQRLKHVVAAKIKNRINDLKNNQSEHERLLGWLAIHSAWEHVHVAEDGSSYATVVFRDVFKVMCVASRQRRSRGPTIIYGYSSGSPTLGRYDGRIVGWQRIDKLLWGNTPAQVPAVILSVPACYR